MRFIKWMEAFFDAVKSRQAAIFQDVENLLRKFHYSLRGGIYARVARHNKNNNPLRRMNKLSLLEIQTTRIDRPLRDSIRNALSQFWTWHFECTIFEHEVLLASWIFQLSTQLRSLFLHWIYHKNIFVFCENDNFVVANYRFPRTLYLYIIQFRQNGIKSGLEL